MIKSRRKITKPGIRKIVEQESAPEIAATIERITAVIDDPLTPEETAFRMRESLAEEMERMLARLDCWNAQVIRKLYPLLTEFKAAGLIHDPAAAHANVACTSQF